jgi:hypothetical protein
MSCVQVHHGPVLGKNIKDDDIIEERKTGEKEAHAVTGVLEIAMVLENDGTGDYVRSMVYQTWWRLEAVGAFA